MTEDFKRQMRADTMRIEGLAAALPADHDGRRAALVEAADAYHAAIMAGDERARRTADERALAALVALNDGELFGFAMSGKAPDQMLDACAAQPGTVPSWGQRGEFVLTVDGMRVRVVFDPNLGRSMPAHIGLHVVDAGKPFISDTGFWSRWQGDMIEGQTVDEAARVMIEQSLSESGRKMLAPGFRERRQAEDVPAWIDGAAAPASDFYEDRGGQVAFAF
ncbi:hypothetical protein ACH0CP_18715 [Sphingomonas sp. 179-I 2A4 NHS]|uniref:hypothetical protein n=1 Tax=unclassified Sphingomonas TaxID=196159 RepID=UPI003879AAC3